MSLPPGHAIVPGGQDIGRAAGAIARRAHAIQMADLISVLISALLPNAGEGYLQDGDATVAYTGDELEAMQAATTAVSRMVAQDVSEQSTLL
jgi:hypothetical protein